MPFQKYSIEKDEQFNLFQKWRHLLILWKGNTYKYISCVRVWVGVGVCDIFLVGCRWMWVGMTFFGWVWVGVGGYDHFWLSVGWCDFFWLNVGGRDHFLAACEWVWPFFAGCGWLWVSVTFFGWVWVGGFWMIKLYLDINDVIHAN